MIATFKLLFFLMGDTETKVIDFIGLERFDLIIDSCARQKWGGWVGPYLGSQSICNMGLDFLL